MALHRGHKVGCAGLCAAIVIAVGSFSGSAIAETSNEANPAAVVSTTSSGSSGSTGSSGTTVVAPGSHSTATSGDASTSGTVTSGPGGNGGNATCNGTANSQSGDSGSPSANANAGLGEASAITTSNDTGPAKAVTFCGTGGTTTTTAVTRATTTTTTTVVGAVGGVGAQVLGETLTAPSGGVAPTNAQEVLGQVLPTGQVGGVALTGADIFAMVAIALGLLATGAVMTIGRRRLFR